VALMERRSSPTEVSRKLGAARSTVYQHIARLRTVFIEAGFGDTASRPAAPAADRSHGRDYDGLGNCAGFPRAG